MPNKQIHYTYNTNVMGPYGLWWYEQNNVPFQIKITNNRFTDFKDVEHKIYKLYYGGRIDVHCSEESDLAVDLPIMEAESFGKFSEWLFSFSSDELLTFEQLRHSFESQSNFKLVLFKNINS